MDRHFEGIIAHATYKISRGRLEGINNKIKTLRRQGYGYPDDDYFFLKLFDASRKVYIRNHTKFRIEPFYFNMIFSYCKKIILMA
ncbi:MAG: transposase [Treponema sp.]|nr:transposase [Treponema sp.]